MRFALGTKLGKCAQMVDMFSAPSVDTRRYLIEHFSTGCIKLIKTNMQDTERLPERLKEPLKTCAIDEAPLRDTGVTPGDGQGALGFDSTLYA